MKQIIITFALVLAAANLAAQSNLMPRGDFSDKPGYFLMRIGFVSGENIKLDGRDEDGQPGFSFGAAMDFRIVRSWYVGVGCDIHRVHISDSGQYFFDASLALKRSFLSKTSRIALRPGIALGYGTLDHFRLFSYQGIERTHYFVWKATFEVVFFGRNRVAPFIDVGLMGSAFGGNADHDIRFGPFPYIRGGMMF